MGTNHGGIKGAAFQRIMLICKLECMHKTKATHPTILATNYITISYKNGLGNRQAWHNLLSQAVHYKDYTVIFNL